MAFAEYFPERKALRVGFIGGATYEYDGIQPAMVGHLQAAESKGRFVNTVIKPTFPYRKLA